MRKIKLMPKELRPRERLLKYGAEALSTEELFCVLLITGSKNFPISKIASKIADLFSKSNKISQTSLNDLHLGPGKMAQILALLELVKRFNSSQKITLSSPKEVFVRSYEIINEEKEMLLCFYLNGRGELLKKEIIAIGSLNKVNLTPAEIFSVVKETPVAGIIMVHNHPSGYLEPSKKDLLFTKRIKLAGEILGIKLLDHIIVSEKGWRQIKV